MGWRCSLPCGAANPDEARFCRECGMLRVPSGVGERVRVGPPDAIPPEQPGPMEKPQGYGLGWLFFALVWLMGGFAVRLLTALPYAPSFPDRLLILIGAMLTLLAWPAAAFGGAWAWYVILAYCGFTVLNQSIRLLRSGPESLGLHAVSAIWLASHVFWVGYFYKRSAMFGARGRWRWLEARIPRGRARGSSSVAAN